MQHVTGAVAAIHEKPETAGERGIPKRPTTSARVELVGLTGDFNRYRHSKRAGDLDMAVMLLPREVLASLRDEGWPIEAGHLGENFTTEGIDNDAFALGQRWRIGSALELVISRVCDPCTNLAVLPYVGADRIKTFMQVLLGRRGWYARVTTPGEVHVRDTISRLD